MKKSLAILLALVLGMSLCFSACGEPAPQPPAGNTETEEGNGSEPSETPDDNQDDDDQDDPDTPPQPPARTKAEAVAAYDAAVQKINADKNFTYTEIGAEYIAAFEGAKLKVTEKGASVFYATEGDKHYSYTLRRDVWHKDFSETTAAGVFSALTAVLGNVIWSDFEAEDNLLSGTASGEIVQATVTETALTVETAQKKFTLTKLGTTAVSLPADAVDDTDASNFIFTTDENGEIVWNVRAIKEVLEAWAKNEMTDEKGNHVDNQFGEEVFTYMRMNAEYKSREVLYVNVTDKLTWGMLFDVGGQTRIGEIYINIINFTDKVEEQGIKTKSDFADYLLTIRANMIKNSIVDFDVEYTTHDEDYETAHKQEFETLTKNVFAKYHKEKDAADPDYTGAKILFAFKTPVGPINLNSYGEGRMWSQYYIAEIKGVIQFIHVKGVRGLIYGLGYYQNVLQNQEGKWTIDGGIKSIVTIHKQNLVLYDAPIMTIGGGK